VHPRTAHQSYREKKTATPITEGVILSHCVERGVFSDPLCQDRKPCAAGNCKGITMYDSQANRLQARRYVKYSQSAEKLCLTDDKNGPPPPMVHGFN